MQLRAERREESLMSDGPTAGDLPGIDEVLADPAASSWLKTALRFALCRDPVDAAHDSGIPARLLEKRCDKILSKP
jgi:hypothetical protein